MNQPDLFRVSDAAGFVRVASGTPKQLDPDLFELDKDNAHIIRARPKTVDELPDRFRRWVKFHGDHPEVFAWFKQYAEQALVSGRKVGARLIGERIRWLIYFERTATNIDYKLNDHHWPYYARVLMLTDPRFEGFFELRPKKYDATDQDLLDWYGRAPKPPRPHGPPPF